MRMKRRAKWDTKRHRVATVAVMLERVKPREIKRRLSRRWGCTERHIGNYIAEARRQVDAHSHPWREIGPWPLRVTVVCHTQDQGKA